MVLTVRVRVLDPDPTTYYKKGYIMNKAITTFALLVTLTTSAAADPLSDFFGGVYVKVYHNMMTNESCDQTIQDLSLSNWRLNDFYSQLTDASTSLSGDKEFDVTDDIVSTQSYIMDRLWHSYYRYLDELKFYWFNYWSGFTPPRYHRYKETRTMANHCDHIHSMFDGERKGIPTLTALGVLNDGYEGGNFVMFGDDIITLPKGSILVFPSNFLYPHRVDPITKGERYTFVSWLW